MTSEELDSQVNDFEYFYNNVMRLIYDNEVKSMPPLTDYQKEFVKYLMKRKAERVNPTLIRYRTRKIPTYEETIEALEGMYNN